MATDSIADFSLSCTLQFATDGTLHIFTETGRDIALGKKVVDALREYFTRPKALTPRERAKDILERFSVIVLDGPLTDAIAAAIEDAARRGVDWTEE